MKDFYIKFGPFKLRFRNGWKHIQRPDWVNFLGAWTLLSYRKGIRYLMSTISLFGFEFTFFIYFK